MREKNTTENDLTKLIAPCFVARGLNSFHTVGLSRPSSLELRYENNRVGRYDPALRPTGERNANDGINADDIFISKFSGGVSESILES